MISYDKPRRYFNDIVSQLIDNIRLNKVTFAAYIKNAVKVTLRRATKGCGWEEYDLYPEVKWLRYGSVGSDVVHPAKSKRSVKTPESDTDWMR